MTHEMGTCPVCNGTTRVPVPEASQRYRHVLGGYDAATDTIPCSNCGGQYMFGTATGKVRVREDGTPCKHEYTGKNLGRCYNGYTCKHCGDYYTIDSSD